MRSSQVRPGQRRLRRPLLRRPEWVSTCVPRCRLLNQRLLAKTLRLSGALETSSSDDPLALKLMPILPLFEGISIFALCREWLSVHGELIINNAAEKEARI